MSLEALCRDCLQMVPIVGNRCSGCGSPRYISHPELQHLAIAHIDCDAFYAAIEKRDHPEWIDKPVIVGGGQRGVVSTCCYIARNFGVHSSMPMFKALKACPEAIVIAPNMNKYVAVSKNIHARLLALTPLVEQISIDEAFLDLTGTQRLHQAVAAQVLVRLAAAIEQEIGISISIGLSYAKFLAKLASDLDKPRGFTIIGKAEAVAFLSDKPTSVLWGVGPVTQQRLEKANIYRLKDLQVADPKVLSRNLGEEGVRLQRLALGHDDRRIKPYREIKSISSETTFTQDLSKLDDLLPVALRLSEKVAKRLKEAELAATTVTLKLKDQRFKLRNRARSFATPTQLSSRIFEVVRQLLQKEIDGSAFRLIGIAVHEFSEARFADPDDLIDGMKRKKDKAREAAIDRLRDKFGNEVISRGLAWRPRKDSSWT